MSDTYVEINLDQAVHANFNLIYNNSLPLDFKFYDSNGVAYSVSNVAFVFTVSDELLQRVKFQVINSQWTRPATNEIKKENNPFTLPVGNYKVDFTATFPDGRITTLIDGNMYIRNREKAR